MPDPTAFDITFGPIGVDHVEVNGADITDAVEAVNLVARPGELAKVGLALRPGVDATRIAATGIVIAQPVGDDAARWLRNIDPAELERVAMEGMGFGDESGTAAMLATLIGWAEEGR